MKTIWSVMNMVVRLTVGLLLLATIPSAVSPARAADAPGPYYATPSWDQQLPASTRFIKLTNWGSAAVLDRETGLVWEQSPGSAFRVSWPIAQDPCNDKTVGNRKGWRLPTVQELASLIDPTRTETEETFVNRDDGAVSNSSFTQEELS